jgi:TatD DNase family protein
MSSKKRRAIPRFGHPIIETHCHLDYLEGDDLSAALHAASDVGVERIVTIAVSPDNLDKVRTLAARHPQVWCTQGVHPHEAEHFDSTVEARIIEGCRADPRVVAVGEIGLDYYYDHADRATQRRVFSRQLAIAGELGLPVVIHSREADADMQSILEEHRERLSRRGVIHSFSSSLALAEYALDAGFCLGFNGMVTFRNADNVRQAVSLTPPERLLLETDAPYLTPVPYRGRSNGPQYLPFIAEAVADIKDLPIGDLLFLARRNSLALFFPDDAAIAA